MIEKMETIGTHPLYKHGRPDIGKFLERVVGPGGYAERGLISVSYHPTYPELIILNYTDKTTYEKLWDDVTMNCRGLILNTATKQVVALGFSKFFNLSEQFAPRVRLDAPYEVREKMDGSFGICFFYQGQWHVATRGSFVSDQAKHATELLRSGKSGLDPTRMNVQRTYLSEIIYPENRVVVSYGDTDDLCLLGGFDLTTGEEVELENLAAGTRHSHRNVWTPERPARERVAQVIDCVNRYANHSDKDLGLAISQKNLVDPVNDPASIGFVFTYRKRGEQEVRKAILKAIRPTSNILRGFDGTKIAMNKRTSAND